MTLLPLSSQVTTLWSMGPSVHSVSNLLVALKASQGWAQPLWDQVSCNEVILDIWAVIL